MFLVRQSMPGGKPAELQTGDGLLETNAVSHKNLQHNSGIRFSRWDSPWEQKRSPSHGRVSFPHNPTLVSYSLQNVLAAVVAVVAVLVFTVFHMVESVR